MFVRDSKKGDLNGSKKAVFTADKKKLEESKRKLEEGKKQLEESAGGRKKLEESKKPEDAPTEIKEPKTVARSGSVLLDQNPPPPTRSPSGGLRSPASKISVPQRLTGLQSWDLITLSMVTYSNTDPQPRYLVPKRFVS